MKIRTERPPTAKLSAACAAIDAATALYSSPDLDVPAPAAAPASAPAAVNPEHERARTAANDELTRLANLASRIEDATNAFPGDAAKPGAAAAASAIAACARRAVAEQRDVLARSIEMPTPEPVATPTPAPAAPTAPRRSMDRATSAALERYFSHFEMPNTRWRFRWQLKSDASDLPEAHGQASAECGVGADFSLPVPVGAPWRAPSKLGSIAAINGARLQTGAKPLPLAKLWLVALSTTAEGASFTVARSRKKAPDARIDVALGRGAMATPLAADGSAAGPAVAQDGETIAAIATIVEALSQPIREMIEDRGSVGRLTYQGVEVEELAQPSHMAAAIVAAMAPTIEELRVEYADDPRKLAALENRLDGVPEPTVAADRTADKAPVIAPPQAAPAPLEAATPRAAPPTPEPTKPAERALTSEVTQPAVAPVRPMAATPIATSPRKPPPSPPSRPTPRKPMVTVRARPGTDTIDVPPPPGVAPVVRPAAGSVPNPGRRLARGTNSPPVAAIGTGKDQSFFSQATLDDFEIDVAWSEDDDASRDQTLPGV